MKDEDKAERYEGKDVDMECRNTDEGMKCNLINKKTKEVKEVAFKRG